MSPSLAKSPRNTAIPTRVHSDTYSPGRFNRSTMSEAPLRMTGLGFVCLIIVLAVTTSPVAADICRNADHNELCVCVTSQHTFALDHLHPYYAQTMFSASSPTELPPSTDSQSKVSFGLCRPALEEDALADLDSGMNEVEELFSSSRYN